jgi:two-component system chemotaxis family response regulator WspR
VPVPSRVLLAHFDAAERERLARFLKEGGAEVFVASDGAQARALASEHAPTLALLSCMLQGVSGFEVCRGLGEVAAGVAAVPVVLLSDAEDPYVRARARHVGAKRVLFGSVSSAQLKELLAAELADADVLDVSERVSDKGREDHLFDDLLSARKPVSGESLLARVTDPLTGLVNSEYLSLKVEEECKRAARYGQTLSLVLIEVKSFDQLVESHGRSVGDEALLEIAGVLLCESRDVDVAGRIGAARFHLLLPNTPADGARVVARRIAENVRQRRVAVEGRELSIAVRMGLASADRDAARAGSAEFVRRAEADLASAQLASDGLGVTLRGEALVEPLEKGAAPPKAPRSPKAAKTPKASPAD